MGKYIPLLYQKQIKTISNTDMATVEGKNMIWEIS